MKKKASRPGWRYRDYTMEDFNQPMKKSENRSEWYREDFQADNFRSKLYMALIGGGIMAIVYVGQWLYHYFVK